MVTDSEEESKTYLGWHERRKLGRKKREVLSCIEEILNSEDFEKRVKDYMFSKMKKMLGRTSTLVLEEYLSKNPHDRHRPCNLAKAVIYIAGRRLNEQGRLAPYPSQLVIANSYKGGDERTVRIIYKRILRTLSAK